MRHRYLIANDISGKWYIRRIRVVEHDLEHDEKVYRCDQPLGESYSDLPSAVAGLQLALADAHQ